ncbi:MAG: hypothetical protein EPN25_06360 [Nitrospirae bacterium]|nr:MAG: hypothetical protein EPN25_06360 [Nitrospirota bacterium]
MADKIEKQEELVRCPLCNSYIRAAEGFTCPRCRKGPFCRKHRITGRRECVSCVFEQKHKEILELRQAEKGLKDFLKLLQFIFLLFAVFFITMRLGLMDFVEFLKDSVVTDYLAYFAVIPVAGYLLFFIILYNQRSRIKEIEGEMHTMEQKRMSL